MRPASAPPATSGQSRTPEGVTPRIRAERFAPPDALPRHWCGGSPVKTHLATALSVLFPSAEDHLIIAGVRPFLEALRDPKLEGEVRRFLGQEALHSREHARFNQRLMERYPRLLAIAALEERVFRGLSQGLPARRRLALAAALEHLTAAFGYYTLAYPRDFEGMDATAWALFRWHAVEELEHKAVAFDVHAALGGGQGERIAALAAGAALMTPFLGLSLLSLAYDDGLLPGGALIQDHLRQRRLDRARGPSPGLARVLIGELIPFLRPGFHPWDRDDSALLAREAPEP